jgi:hypothetical protein
MRLDRLIVRVAPIFNAPVAAMTRSPRFGALMGRSFAIVNYTGRKSGKAVSLPVSYRRVGDDVVIGVGMPDAKTWWRNFLGEGAPVTLTLDGREADGHAVATRDEKGGVAVRVQLTQ